jgi:uncharacterized protein YjbJ (UPF0337 family)
MSDAVSDSGVVLFCTFEGGKTSRTIVMREERDVANKEQAEGRIKEAAGDLTGDKDLKRKGQVDQAAGKAKDVVDGASDKVKDALDRE